MSLIQPGRQLTFWEITALCALAMELGGLGLYAWAINSIIALGILFLLALAATGGGGIIGFLFGVPRIRTDAHVSSTFLFNSNLEQVSDWLTKIIIGATLVQIDDIARGLGEISLFIGRSIGGGEGSATAACSVIVFSFVGGFLWAYLWVSLRLKDEYEKDALRLAEKDRKIPTAVQPVG